jgi:hypothetical protein
LTSHDRRTEIKNLPLSIICHYPRRRTRGRRRRVMNQIHPRGFGLRSRRVWTHVTSQTVPLSCMWKCSHWPASTS